MYRSTRSEAEPVGAAKAILDGLAPDGGLYVPVSIPCLPARVLSAEPLSYAELASLVLAPYFPQFPAEGLRAAIDRSASRFSCSDVAPLVERSGFHFLELFHGPTLAFKDLALTLMGALARLAMRTEGVSDELVVLVATSGDTGKAALSGFAEESGVSVAVFYPAYGVSPVQRLQMVCHDAPNSIVIGIRGSFDDAQRGVKAIFGSEGATSALSKRGMRLTSANSINIARLLPQIVYYVKAWRDLRDAGRLGNDRTMDVAVPTGNFGNILAAWYAREMGVPIGRFYCASNDNKVLADFLGDSVYDRNRPFYVTSSPSMDILVSSNLERLVFAATSSDSGRTAGYMRALAETGRFSLTKGERAAFADFRGGWADEAEASAAIRRVFEDSGYLLDPHTAVAVAVAEKARSANSSRPVVVAATASPFKFPVAVARAIGMDIPVDGGAEAELDLAMRLAERTGLELPAAIADLRGKPELHASVIDPAEMERALLSSPRLER
ncbi:MAG: threonine synthase [Spirochaetaceae bacterium]|nr:threonine synthase [Spirochaetaceae bacterium]